MTKDELIQALRELPDTIDDLIIEHSDELLLSHHEKNSLYQLKRYLYNELVPRLTGSKPYTRLLVLDENQRIHLQKALTAYLKTQDSNSNHTEELARILDTIKI